MRFVTCIFFENCVSGALNLYNTAASVIKLIILLHYGNGLGELGDLYFLRSQRSNCVFPIFGQYVCKY